MKAGRRPVLGVVLRSRDISCWEGVVETPRVMVTSVLVTKMDVVLKVNGAFWYRYGAAEVAGCAKPGNGIICS
jgi:hypothetical protein